MVDSETVVAQTSTVMVCTSAGFPSTVYADVSLNVSGALPSEAAGDISTSSAPTDVAYSASGGNLGDSNTVNVDSSSHMQESLVANSYEMKTAVGMIDSGGSVAAAGNEAMGSTQAAGNEAMGSTQAAGNEAMGSTQAAGNEAMGSTQAAGNEAMGSTQAAGNEAMGSTQAAGNEAMGSTQAAGNEAMGSTQAAGNEAMGSTQAARNEAMGPTQAAGYDFSVNGNADSAVGTSVLTENGDVSDHVVGAVDARQYVDGSAVSAEEERLWNIVRANFFDFNAWTALIDETENVAENNILKIRKVYDAFLAEFPLCYGYWKKYADHEARMDNMDKVVEVYERAVQNVTYSVDIWLHYCIFSISTYGDPDTVRRLFDRGLAYVGSDYLSYPLWDKYIEYEYLQQNWGHLADIYTRILENPNQQLDRHFNSFKELVANRPLSELKTGEEAAVGAAVAGAPSELSNLVNGVEVNSDVVNQSSKCVSAGLTEAEELEKYITIREEMYKKAKEFDSKIIGFETAIRRPYFHVRPLNSAELENWHDYLDFIEREGDFNKVVKLYERCLIACANYPKYWIRYVLCMEAGGSLDLANNALARATQVFVKRQPEIHIFAARFKEQNEDISGARAAYQHVHSEISPGLLEAIVKHANMEKRLGNLEVACSLYEQAIAIEKGKEHSQTLSILFAQFSRFVYLAFGNAEKAREILVEALEHVHLSKPLLEALIHFESIQSQSKQINYIDLLVVKFIDPNSESSIIASIGDREELSCIFLEFLNLFGDAGSIKKAEDRHAKFFLPHRSTSELKKRSAEDYQASDKTKIAKTYSGVASSGHSLIGAYPNAQNQWVAGYGVQPQGWPPATQAQGQQWTPGYAQQAVAYSAYGYTAPQVPTLALQNAAYATYPPTYPAQHTFPQQSYAQPAAASTLTPAQQPSSAAPAYYGSYY